MSAAPVPADCVALDPRELRRAFGSFTTGVVVLTAACDGGEHGMTANSFTSVSLKPPLVLICVHNDARMSRVLERGMPVGVSVLAADQERVSRHFAGRPQDGYEMAFTWQGGVPLIAGALAHFACVITDAHVCGDHTVTLAEVEYWTMAPKAPLVFFRGDYARLVPPP